MILAWHRNGVSDGGHSADVMKKMDGGTLGTRLGDVAIAVLSIDDSMPNQLPYPHAR